MADRELPPLRVKLIGDDSSYKSMMDRASKQADDLAKHVSAIGRQASRGSSTRATPEEAREARRLRAEQAANRANLAAQQRLQIMQGTAQQRAARAAAALNNANAAAQQRLENAQMAQYRQNAQTQQRMHQAAQMHQARMARQAQILANGTRRAGGGGGGGFQGLGGRADIYMGTHGIRNIMGAVAGPAQSAMDFQDAGIAMTAYTGSAEKAAAALKEVQEFALMSPYSSKVLIDNAKSMMSYGISSEKTLEMLKQLGNVAGGNAERMHLLSYAMAQVNSMGILQGQELRQLTESGFNPLMVMAKEMTNTEEEATKKFKELKEAMADGKITAEMVGKALQNVTAKGGMFAGLLDKLNNSTRGLTNQFLEYADLIQRNLFASIQDQIDEFLKTGVAYMKFLSDLISQNKELAKSIATWVWRAIVAVTAILAFTVAMAAARWMVHAMIPLLGFAYSGFMLLARGAMFAYTAVLTPVGAVIAAIAAVAAAIAVLAFGWTGVASGAKWAFDNALGFVWNFGENTKSMLDWLMNYWSYAWKKMSAGAQLTWNDVTGWTADRMLELAYIGGQMTADQVKEAKRIRKETTEAKNKAVVGYDAQMPTLKLNTSLPAWEMPKYEESNTPIADKENVDWNAMMGAGKGDSAGGSGGRGSLDIAGYARGSADAEARARAFMAGIGKPISSTPDRKLSNEEKMAKFLRDIERNTRHPTKMDTTTIL